MKTLEIWGRVQREAAQCHKSDCRDNFGWFKCRAQQRHLANEFASAYTVRAQLV